MSFYEYVLKHMATLWDEYRDLHADRMTALAFKDKAAVALIDIRLDAIYAEMRVIDNLLESFRKAN